MIGIYWITLYANANVKYFDSFGVQHIPKEIKNSIGNKNIITNIYRIQVYNSIMCGYFCIGFIDFMLKGKNAYNIYFNTKIMTEYSNLF